MPKSGRYATESAMRQVMNGLLQQGYLLYAEPQQSNSDANGWRFVSGKYTSLDVAVAAATKIINAGKLGYVTIAGTIN